eukprot:CAMPEP_0171755766 /NCGR_PEP_ID=MMETSP0991-20121206/44656_1 /TAXON_ID=483369 /ORGANISM="non described non described, Strain CCMP2098" /LENGTH=134 /DNA_ID=CAMNT_0012357901 /DNA_START=374 /DNA_END=778 /DNA_ORIENTATION=+
MRRLRRRRVFPESGGGVKASKAAHLVELLPSRPRAPLVEQNEQKVGLRRGRVFVRQGSPQAGPPVPVFGQAVPHLSYPHALSLLMILLATAAATAAFTAIVTIRTTTTVTVVVAKPPPPPPSSPPELPWPTAPE